jgi:hypothetical protein
MSSTGSTNSSAIERADREADCLDFEILWEDLAIGEQVGQGSYFSLGKFSVYTCRNTFTSTHSYSSIITLVGFMISQWSWYHD